MLKLVSVSKYYRSPESVTQALRRVSLNMNIGEFVVITGESGSGKSTLLNVLSGLDSYEEGELFVNNEETSYYAKEDWERYRSQYIGFIFQNYNIIDSYTVYQNVVTALTIQGYPKEQRKARALELIDRVGLSEQKNQKSSTLSGGQKQRVSIARALAKDAPIIVADEPTGNLDKDAGQNIIQLLKEISAEKLVVMVTHNYEEVKAFATRRVRLFDGEIVEDKTLVQAEVKTIEAPALHEGMALGEKIAMSIRNLFSMPKRFILTLSISLFIVLVFSFVYGSYVESSNAMDISYWHPYFQNNDKSRIIVVRRDGEPFTETELETLASISNVRSVLPFDPLLDLQMGVVGRGYYNILPSTSISQSDLSSGRLPQNYNEIVIPKDRGDIGDIFMLSTSQEIWMYDESVTNVGEAFTVVGISRERYSYNIYLHVDFFDDAYYQFQATKNQLDFSLYYNNDLFLQNSNIFVVIDDSLENNDVLINNVLFEQLRDFGFGQMFPNFSVEDLENEVFTLNFTHILYEGSSEIRIVGTYGETGEQRGWESGITLNRETFEALFSLESRQITLIVQDNFDANRVLNQLDKQTYHTVYPAEYESPGMFNFAIFTRIMSLISVAFLLTVMYFLTYLSLRNIMRARKKDYVIYRSIGATQKDLNQITIFELIFLFVVAFITVYSALAVNAYMQTIIPNYLRFYSIGNYLFAIFLLIGLAIAIGLRFNQRIFKDSVITALRVE
ncbi:ATP-binding cassette domain-containing protein [Liberiplasma polymorphum]|uniref:ABC transporter ATP-binding protein/permease n=1 Tax=Liberiplasma polymorphum TaxID=3374570 RepID=UPI0037745B20